MTTHDQIETTPTEILRNEHDVILRVLDVLEKMVRRIQEGQRPDLEQMEKALEFFSGFADEEHHMKEEQALFPAMAECGFPVGGGPIGVMLQEHEEGRRLLHGLREGVAAVATDPEHGSAQVTRNALDYLVLLRNHIDKENQILFPMAERSLSPETLQRVLEQFRQTEAGRSPGVRERYLQLARELEEHHA